MLAEKWCDVVGFEGRYRVSDLGNVFSAHSQKVLKPKVRRDGRLEVSLSTSGKVSSHTIHTLVATAFLGNRPADMEVCHINGVCFDNRVSNLRWGTHSSNMLDKVKHGTHHEANKATCERGHTLAGENLRIRFQKGRTVTRICLTCVRIRYLHELIKKEVEMYSPEPLKEVLA